MALEKLEFPNFVTTLIFLVLFVSIFGIVLIGGFAIENFNRAMQGRCEMPLDFCNSIMQFVPENQRTVFGAQLATSNFIWYFLLPMIGIIFINYAFLHRIFVRTLNFQKGIIAVLAVVFGLSTLPLGSFVTLTAVFYAIAGAYASYMFVAIAIFGAIMLGLESFTKLGTSAKYKIAETEIMKASDEEKNKKTNLYNMYDRDRQKLIEKVKLAFADGNRSLANEIMADVRAVERKMTNLEAEVKTGEELVKMDIKELEKESETYKKKK